MRCNAHCFDELRAFIETVPIVDCHDHGVDHKYEFTDPIAFVVRNNYLWSDVGSVIGDQGFETVIDTSLPFNERWPLFERAWQGMGHTGYAQVPRRVLHKYFGITCITRETML